MANDKITSDRLKAEIEAEGEDEGWCDRRKLLKELFEDDENWVDKFQPGTFGCHEAMHMAMVILNLVGERLCDHPAILRNAQWYEWAQDAQGALYQLYQAIGQEHIDQLPTPVVGESDE